MRMWGDCLEGVAMLSAGFVEAVWMIWGGCLWHLVRLYG